MSCDLSGTIDEVEQRANLPWVQPRVLDTNQVISRHALYEFDDNTLAQLATIKTRFESWSDRISATAISMETTTPELFQQAFL